MPNPMAEINMWHNKLFDSVANVTAVEYCMGNIFIMAHLFKLKTEVKHN